jgi:glycosidase
MVQRAARSAARCLSLCEPSDWGNYGTDLLTPGAFNAVITKPWQFASRDAVNQRNATGLYSSTASTYAAIPLGKLAVAQVSDHDSDRIASVLGNSAARQKVLAAIQMTQPFPPNIYFGDELGMRGTKAATGTDADDIPMREPFKWKAVAGAPMSNYTAITAGTVPPSFSANNDGRSVEEENGCCRIDARNISIADRGAEELNRAAAWVVLASLRARTAACMPSSDITSNKPFLLLST